MGNQPALAQLSDSIPVLEVTAQRPDAKGAIISDLGTTTALNPHAFDARSPIALDELMDLAPSALVRTNSRGETLVFLRGAGERETTVMLDGVPLAIPWDNRVDLSILPATIVSTGTVTAGPTAIRYGARSVGGVVELFTRWADETPRIKTSMRLGDAGLFQMSAMLNASVTKTMHLMAAGSYASHDNQPQANAAALPFSQASMGGRTNTDRKTGSGFVRLMGKTGPLDWSFSGLHGQTRMGIAPEADRDPATALVRFWRYPDRSYSLFSASVDHRPESGGIHFTGRLWHQRFDQDIEDYQSVAYGQIGEVQTDHDRSWGGYFAAGKDGHHWQTQLTGNFYTTRHHQRIVQGSSALSSDDLFGERFVRLVGDVRRQLGALGGITVSLGVDWQDLTRTAGRPSQPDFVSLTGAIGFHHQITQRLTIGASAGRKNRQPTLRELFGTALNRFEPNPDLRAERHWLIEGSMAYRAAAWDLIITPFARFIDNSITQRAVPNLDGPDKRQRINAADADIVGIETQFNANLTNQLVLDVRATRQWARPDSEASANRLAERPGWIAGGGVSWFAGSRLSMRLEAQLMAGSYSEGPDGTLSRLPSSVRLNWQGRWLIQDRADGQIALVARIDNVTDTLVVPQAGLPDPGRWASLQITFTR